MDPADPHRGIGHLAIAAGLEGEKEEA